jgi:cytochrome c
MGGIEFNKIFAAVLVAGIVAMFSGFVAEKLTKPKELKENAFKIEGVEVAGGGAKVEKMAEPIMAMLADADIARGQKVSKACAACHSFDKGGADGVGPHLWGVVGRAKDSVAGFTYSGALAANGASTWTYDSFNKFLWKPKNYAPGTKMNYVGLKKPEDRAAIIAYLRTLDDSPKPLPTPTQIAAEEAELLPPAVEEKIEDAIDTIEAVVDGVQPTE